VLHGVVPHPPTLAERYRQEGYWGGDTLGGLLRSWAERSGDRTAVVDGDRRVSYAGLDEGADRLALGLLELGLQPQDRVMVHLPNVTEFFELVFACFRIGVLPVFALPAHREHELVPLCDFASATAYVAPSAHRHYDPQELAATLQADVPSLKHVVIVGDKARSGFHRLGDLVREDASRDEIATALADRAPNPSDVAFFLLSGGTTGLPKLIPRTHDDYSYNVRGSAEVARLDEEDVYLVSLPIGHNFPFGCFGALGVMHAGGRVVMCHDPNPGGAFPLIEEEAVTCSALVPALALRWLDAAADGADHDLSSLRVLQVGGAKFNPEPARRVGPVLGCTLQQVFGMAEGLLNYTRLDDPADVIVTTQGRPMSPADEIRIVDDAGEQVDNGKPGELLTRGPYTIRGYYSAPEHNERSFTEDGFYRTGDIVRLHPASGNLIVEGRAKDIINRGGENISAEEIENLVLAHPKVANAAAVAMPDRELGERVCVYVILRDEADPLSLEELVGFLEDRKVARFHFPERLETVDSFPMTGVGKISKQELRDDIASKLEAEATNDSGGTHD
jgi:2,3-dihydroxybenzoate-AMP ligase